VQDKLARSKEELTAEQTTSTAEESAPEAFPSGKVSLSNLPESEELQARITVTQPSCGSATDCVWSSAATQYPLSVGKCPTSLDDSHIFWTGPIETAAGTVHQTTAFRPMRAGSLLICLYVHKPATGDQLAYGLKETIG
jgi:hypothetical protein